MKKTLLVLTLVLAGSLSAHAVPLKITFDGFCDFLNLNRVGAVLYGIHDYSTCSGLTSYPIMGTRHGMPLTGLPGFTPVYDIGDPALAPSLAFEFFVTTKNACTWNVYFSDGSGVYLANFGTCKRTASKAKVEKSQSNKTTTFR